MQKTKSNGYIYNLYIKKEVQDEFEITYARKGRFEQSQGYPILVLYSGETIMNKKNKITNFKFSKSDFLLQNLKANTITQQKNQEMNTYDVISCLIFIYNLKFKFLYFQKEDIVNCTESNKVNMVKELYKRLIIPFYIPILMIIPYLLILSSKEKKNYSKLKITTFLIGIFVIVFSEGMIRFLSKELIDNLVIFVTPLIILLSFYFVFLLKFKFRN